MQIPIGLEGEFEGVVDIITREAVHFLGDKGTQVKRSPVPEALVDQCEAVRKELIEKIAEVDDEIGFMHIRQYTYLYFVHWYLY